MMIKLGSSRLKLLRSLAACGVLTARQAGYIAFNLKAKPNKDESVSHTWAERNLDEMKRDGLVWKERMRVRTHEEGAYPFLYGLERPGVAAVLECYDIPGTLKPLSPQEREQKLGNLHDQLVADVLIAAARAPALGLLEWKHGRTLRQELTEVPAVPDGWLRFPRETIFVEVDNSAKETEPVWKAKVRNLMASLEMPQMQTYWHETRPCFAVVVIKGEGRRDRLRQWTAEAVPEAYGYFLFTSEVPTSMAPLAYFCTNHWYYPNDDEPFKLLTAPDAS